MLISTYTNDYQQNIILSIRWGNICFVKSECTITPFFTFHRPTITSFLLSILLFPLHTKEQIHSINMSHIANKELVPTSFLSCPFTFLAKIFLYSRKKYLLCNKFIIYSLQITPKSMKKNILSLAVIVAAFTFALPSQAQMKFGIKAGLNVDNVNLKNVNANLDSKNRTGFFAGVTADFTIPLAGLGADIAVLYDNKVIGLEENGAEANKTLHYIDIPVNVKYTIGLSSLASVYFAAGPQFSWNVGDRNWKPANINQDWELKKSEFSLNVGAGATVLKHVRIGYNFNIGLGKTAETTVIGTATNAVKGKLRNNTHQISLTYIF